MSDSVWPHRWPPTRLLCPQDSPGKITGVGCHFFLLIKALLHKLESFTEKKYSRFLSPPKDLETLLTLDWKVITGYSWVDTALWMRKMMPTLLQSPPLPTVPYLASSPILITCLAPLSIEVLYETDLKEKAGKTSTTWKTWKSTMR